MVNKYLEHILRKANKTRSIPECIEDLRKSKEKELKTYLFLIQKRLKLKNATNGNRH
jgi:hypothetical protein